MNLLPNQKHHLLQRSRLLQIEQFEEDTNSVCFSASTTLTTVYYSWVPKAISIFSIGLQGFAVHEVGPLGVPWCVGPFSTTFSQQLKPRIRQN